jgi:tetratricopeptide (TPR) repeat protein
LYFTYNGGPVFNLNAARAPASQPSAPAASGGASSDTQPAAGGVDPTVQADQAGHADQPPLPPGDPAELSRVGMAAAGRRDFDTALADLNRAVELAPDNPDYLFQRGSVHWQNRQPDLAMADFNRAIELKPDHVPALMDRAEMRIAGKNIDGAKSDLDAVDKTAAQQADVRLELARAYERAGFLESSIAQYELWTASHQADSRFGGALGGLCVTRALLNEDLPKALRNCNDAFKLAAKGSPLAAGALGGRGLVRLRLGDTDKAIADFDDSLKLNPRNAWSLYARGIAKVRKSKTAEGEGDMAEAAKIAPHIADQFAKWGITP